MEQTKPERYRRNYLLLVLEGSFFMGGNGFINSATVIPVFIDLVTHNRELVGLALTLGSFCTYFGRLLVGPFMPHVRNNARFATLVMFLCRPQTLLTAVFIFFGHSLWAVAALIYSYSLLWLADGVLLPPWSEVLANTVDESRHGRVLGLQMLFGGFAAVGAGALINVFLNNPRMNTMGAFGIIFLLGGAAFTVSCFCMSLTANAPAPYKTGRVDFRGYYGELPKYLKREKDNTRVLFTQFLMMVSGMGVPFIILLASDKIGLSTGVTASLIMAQALGTPLGGWFWGQICDRLGCEKGIRLAVVNALIISLLPLIALWASGVISPLLFLLPAMFLAGANGGAGNCYYVYTVQAVRPASRSACLVLGSVVTLPATFSSYLAGFLSERFGFGVLFAAASVVSAAAIAFSFAIRPVAKVVAERREETEVLHI